MSDFLEVLTAFTVKQSSSNNYFMIMLLFLLLQSDDLNHLHVRGMIQNTFTNMWKRMSFETSLIIISFLWLLPCCLTQPSVDNPFCCHISYMNLTRTISTISTIDLFGVHSNIFGCYPLSAISKKLGDNEVYANTRWHDIFIEYLDLRNGNKPWGYH